MNKRSAKLEAAMARVDWAAIRALSEEEIERRALSDPDNPPWTDEELAQAVADAREKRKRAAAE